MKRFAWIGLAFGIVIGAAAPSAAQAPAPAGSAPAPDTWWERTSLAGSGPDATWKWHVEGSLAPAWADGNTDGYSVDANAGLVTRHRRVTNRVDISSARHDMVYGLGGGSVDTSEHTVRNHMEYDVRPHIVAVGGVEFYRNSLMFIDGRTAIYGGAGVAIVDTARQKLNVVGGVGYAFFNFDHDGMLAIDPVAVAALPTDTPTSVGILGMQAWHLTLPNHMQISEDASFTNYVNDDLGHQWMVGVSLTVPMTSHVSLVPAFRAREEANIYIEALQVKELDRSFNFALRVSF